jgi:hypothetical protein
MVDLTGQLANLSEKLKALLDQPLPTPSVGPSAASDKPFAARRRLGDIRDAMVEVLAQESDFLQVADIYARVVMKLEEPVTYDYVKDFLNSRTRTKPPLFERGGWGRYRLHPELDVTRLWPLSSEPSHQRS